MKDIFQLIIQTLGLGNNLVNFEPLHGGALHKMWRLDTDQGQYALKQINEHITEKESFPTTYEISEKISDSFYNSGIQAVSALKFNNHFVHNISGLWCILYPYIHGKVIPIDELNERQLQDVGHIFADLHTLKLNVEGVDTAHYDIFEDSHWTHLIHQAKVTELIELLPKIHDWNKKYSDAIEHLNQNLVVTHRDLHHINVLWDDQLKAHVIDWETAGLMNPLLEIIGYGYEWGGIITDTFQKSNTFSILKSYQEKMNLHITIEDIQHAFFGWLGHCVLGWTEFNLRRMLGETSSDPEEINIGHNIINNNMKKCIDYISKNEALLIDVPISTLL